MSETNFYKLLGLKPGAPANEVKRAFRALARQYHPDSGHELASDYMFQKITEAYDHLSDPDLKAEYDAAHRQYSDIKEKVDVYKNADKFKFGSGKSSSTDNTNATTSTNFEGPSGLRFGGMKIKPDGKEAKESSIFGKVTEKLQRVKESTDGLFGKVTGTQRRDTVDGKGTKSIPRDGAEFTFSINALESLHGTTRELTFEGANGPRLIRVKIPAGVMPGALLKVNCPPKEDEPGRIVHVRVQIDAHELVEREGCDIIVKVPITVGEAVNGTEIEIPTLEGPVKIRIPPGWDIEKRLRLKSRGLALEAGGERGHMFVKTYVVLPDAPSEELAEAAKQLDRLYRTEVRKDLPKHL